MRVALVSEHASPLAELGGVDAGGQNVHVASLAVELSRLGADVVVHTRRDGFHLPDRVEMAPGVVVDHVAAGPPRHVPKDELLPFMPEFAAALARTWRQDRPDLAHAHFWMSGHASVMAARPLGIPVVQTFHALGVVKRRCQGDRDTSPPERQPVERDLLSQVQRVVATCTDEVFELARLGADPRKVDVIPCGVDLDLFTPAGPVEPRQPGVRRLVVVSRLVERKGVGNVITALAGVPDTELVVAGGPDASALGTDPEARRLESLARQTGVADRVHLRGKVERPRLPALLRSADLVVCVPWYEPFGIVPLEAMACGVPVVASAVGGLVDTIVDGVTGVHVPPRQPSRLATVLSALLDDIELLRALGQAGAERARARYSWARVARSTLDTYRAVVSPALARSGEGYQ